MEEIRNVKTIDYYPKEGKIVFYKSEDSKLSFDKADEIHSEDIAIVKRKPESLMIEFSKIVTCKLKEKYPRVWVCEGE